MRISHNKDERIQDIWSKTEFDEIDNLGFYHFKIPVTPTKIIDFAIEPSLARVYKSLIREMEAMHKKNQRQSYVETDDYRTPITPLSNAVASLDSILDKMKSEEV